MKKIITTVGTSIFNNCLKFEVPDIKFHYNHLKDKDYDQWEENKDDQIKILCHKVNDWAKDKNNASAEIASLLKIQEELKEKVEIHLICTETIFSRLAGECIQKWFGGKNDFEIKEPIVVKDLQVKNRKKFEKNGLTNLINEIEKIGQNGSYWDDCILNITGGYKGTIPFLTILGQVNMIPIYYIFEENETDKYELIKMPNAPIDYKREIFERYWDEFRKIETGEVVEKNNLKNDFLVECSSCLTEAEDYIELNALGKILWNNYSKSFFLFYSTDDIFNEIEKQPDITRILKGKFKEFITTKNKTEKKQDHLVYDDGNNNNRIYYFEDSGKIFIYKTFESEEKAKAYISTAFKENGKMNFTNKSKEFKIEITK